MIKVSKDDNNYIYYWVGKNVRKYRKLKGWTQRELADLIKYNEGTIANIENNSFQTFSLEFIYVIFKTLNIPMEEFFKDIE